MPVYMPKPFYTPENDLREVEEEHLAVYAAFDGDEPVAHLAVHPGGETFLDQDPASRHIGAAYCRPETRGNGLIDALLDAAQRDLAAQGVPLLGVDCETLNLPAFRCWSKRFSPFTYSFVRRLTSTAPCIKTENAPCSLTLFIDIIIHKQVWLRRNLLL